MVARGARGRQMLRDLDRDAEVMTRVDRDRAREIGRAEVDPRAAQRRPVHPVAVEAGEPRAPEPLGGREPGALPATDVDHGRWNEHVEHDRQHDGRRLRRPFDLIGVEAAVVALRVGDGHRVTRSTRASTPPSRLPMYR